MATTSVSIFAQTGERHRIERVFRQKQRIGIAQKLQVLVGVVINQTERAPSRQRASRLRIACISASTSLALRAVYRQGRASWAVCGL